MLTVRKSEDRGRGERDWLKSKHTFSFADYYDPKHINFRVLRVINEDWIKGGTGFGMHGHNDMEIITYVLDGELKHQDTLGNSAGIKPGEVQRMSAGTGIKHSEINNLPDKETHLLQIWILPNKEGIEPGYEQKSFEKDLQTGKSILVASQYGDEGSVKLHQDIKLYATRPKTGDCNKYLIPQGRHVWLQIAKGSFKVNDDVELNEGDGLQVSDEARLKIESLSGGEYLLFDLP